MTDHDLLSPTGDAGANVNGNGSTDAGGDFDVALSQRYLAYALSTITARSLPDVRDGLKPVHRRLLYAMRQLRLDPNQGFKKSARVVGDVMGKFHPHGDAAIYEAMVRLAQEFAMRYPLVDGQGNFGNIDGDNAAAMRYTEARMSPIANMLMDGLDEDAVDFRPTYDGEEDEPVVMPAAFPNLLANGAHGIAVGMATSVPPHNILELAEAALYLLDQLESWHDKIPTKITNALTKLVKAPDFPTGGVLLDEGNIANAYKKGRGSFRLRAQWTTERQARGAHNIVITEIPYQVQKTRLIEKIADLMQARKLPFIGDIQDESTEDVRIVIEPRSRALAADAIMENLFRLTDLEVRVPFNLNVLDAKGIPGIMSLAEALRAWLMHRQQVLQRTKTFRLKKIDARLEVLAGYLIVYGNIDQVIAIIRTHDQPKQQLMQRFKLNDRQATAILDMRLRSLRKLEEAELRAENEALLAEKKEIQHLLADDAAQKQHLKDGLTKLVADFKAAGDTRKTAIATPPQLADDPTEMLAVKEAVTIVCSEKGWIRSMKGRIAKSQDIRFKEGDAAKFHIYADSTDRLLIGLANGRFFTLGVDRLPGGRSVGEPLALMLDMPAEEAIVSLHILKPKPLLLVSSTGYGFVVTDMQQLSAQTKGGKKVMSFSAGGGMVRACDASHNHAAFYASNDKLLIIPTTTIRPLNKGQGVILQKQDGDDRLLDAVCFNSETGLAWFDQKGQRHVTEDFSRWLGTRANKGLKAPKGFVKFDRDSAGGNISKTADDGSTDHAYTSDDE